RIASYKTFLDTLPGINADIISFGNRLARALLAYEIPQNHLVSASINVGFSMIANCKCCGGSVPLTGPRESYSCPTCSNIVTISRENWRTILRRPLEQHEMTHENMVNNNAIFFLTSEVQSELRECEWNLVAPRCLHCDQGLEEQAVGKIPAGTNERIPCPLCGKENVALPPPRWVKDLVPAIGILVNAQTDTQGEAPPLTEPDDIKPIIFSCPQCAANLSITRDRERTLTCTYCNASVYLPDGLWFKLHPPKTRRIWTARYDYRLPPATGT
ncbi:hypothetical protein KJ865_01930, partial [Myxococcota bacterium]|nr:hypothetical protein [Myxococcota bacterium]